MPSTVFDADISFSIDKKGKFSRKRLNEEEGDITYINEHNRVFNKKAGFFSFNSVCTFLPFCYIRLRDTTTSIRPRYAPVSSEVPLYKTIFRYRPSLCFPATGILVSFLVAGFYKGSGPYPHLDRFIMTILYYLFYGLYCSTHALFL